MDKINFFPENLEIQNQKIILRLDLNVPLKEKVIQPSGLYRFEDLFRNISGEEFSLKYIL